MKARVETSRRPNVVGLHLLRALNVKEAKVDTPDGGGLWLRVKGDKANWILRYKHNGVRRDLSLGQCYRADLAQAGRSLTDARTAAATARSLISAGKDPIAERKAQRTSAKAEKLAGKKAEQQAQLTLARAAREYHERVIEPSVRASRCRVRTSTPSALALDGRRAASCTRSSIPPPVNLAYERPFSPAAKA